MSFCDFLIEGGAALKSVEKISQEEVRELLPDLIKKVAAVLELKPKQVRLVGSAGKKEDGQLSGDVDLAVEFPADKLESKLPRLAYDEKTCRAMRGINVYSFAEKVGGKVVQIDLIPTPDVEYAAWAMQANPADLEDGLKGSHRNELMFAVAKYAGMKELDDEIERYFYDLSRGLYKGIQVKKAKGGYKTSEKKFLTSDVDSVVKILFGQRATKLNTSSYAGVLELIKASEFPHAAVRDKILTMAAKGMEKKGLKVPPDLSSDSEPAEEQ